jgi:DNA processing protein
MDGRASGCNMLIRDGALLVRSAADVLSALAEDGAALPATTQSLALTAPQPDAAQPRDLEQRILSRLSPSPSDENDMIRELGVSAALANAAILSLELQGLLTRLAGGRLARCQSLI